MSAIYPTAKKKFLDADIDLLVDTIKVALVSATYTYSAAHEFYSSITGIVGTPGTLATKTTTGGVFDADDLTFTSVTGSAVTQLIIYKDTGSAATSPVIAQIDGFSSVTPNGGNITIAWDSGASKIFAL
jgi:hypothetical protein